MRLIKYCVYSHSASPEDVNGVVRVQIQIDRVRLSNHYGEYFFCLAPAPAEKAKEQPVYAEEIKRTLRA